MLIWRFVIRSCIQYNGIQDYEKMNLAEAALASNFHTLGSTLKLAVNAAAEV